MLWYEQPHERFIACTFAHLFCSTPSLSLASFIDINGKITNDHNYFGIKNGQAMSSHDYDFTFAANLGRVDSIVSRLSSMCRLPIMMSPTALRAHVSRCHLWHSCRSIYLTPLEGTYSHEAKLQVSAAQRCENTDNLVTFIVPVTFCLHKTGADYYIIIYGIILRIPRSLL